MNVLNIKIKSLNNNIFENIKIRNLLHPDLKELKAIKYLHLSLIDLDTAVCDILLQKIGPEG
jgi:hypothetical protein